MPLCGGCFGGQSADKSPRGPNAGSKDQSMGKTSNENPGISGSQDLRSRAGATTELTAAALDPLSNRKRGNPNDVARKLSGSKGSETNPEIEDPSQQNFVKILQWIKDAEEYDMCSLGVDPTEIVNIEDGNQEGGTQAEQMPPSEADRFPRRPAQAGP